MDDKNLGQEGLVSAPLILLERIFLPDFQPSDLQWLLRLDRIGSDRVSSKALLEQIGLGWLDAWRISGSGEGLLLTSLTDEALVISGLVGKNLVPARASFFSRLCKMRDSAGKIRIQGEVSRPGLRRLYEALGLRTVAHIMEI